MDDVIDYIPTLWELCFKARDDIKESVRQAADAACRTLSKVSTGIYIDFIKNNHTILCKHFGKDPGKRMNRIRSPLTITTFT